MYKRLYLYLLSLAFAGYAQASDDKTIRCQGEEHEISKNSYGFMKKSVPVETERIYTQAGDQLMWGLLTLKSQCSFGKSKLHCKALQFTLPLPEGDYESVTSEGTLEINLNTMEVTELTALNYKLRRSGDDYKVMRVFQGHCVK